MEWRRLGGGGPMRPMSTRGPDRPAAISAAVELSGLRSRKPAATATSCFDYSDRAHQLPALLQRLERHLSPSDFTAIAAGSRHDDCGGDPIGLSWRSSPSGGAARSSIDSLSA
jgi:hypothetical protein